jgi:predicted P-loop ATPase
MTILEGEQGTKKSTVWNTLASDAWFTDWLPDLHDKEAAQTLCGKWFIELGELANIQRSEAETVKRFLSAKQDHYRPSYGKRAQTFPRQNVFVGSTNEEHYFKDATGNRRFWPVKLEGTCEVDALQRDRDQLWAEAVVRSRPSIGKR